MCYNRKTKIDYLVPTWDLSVIKALLYTMCISEIAVNAADFGLFEMIEFRGAIGKILTGVPTFIWQVLSIICESMLLLCVYRSMAGRWKRHVGEWLIGVIVAVPVLGFCAMSDNETLLIVLGIVGVAVFFVAGLMVSREYSGSLGTLGRLFMYLPVVTVAVVLITLMVLPDTYGEINEREYDFGIYSRVEYSYSTSTVVWTAILVLLASLSEIIPLWFCYALLDKGAKAVEAGEAEEDGYPDSNGDVAENDVQDTVRQEAGNASVRDDLAYAPGVRDSGPASAGASWQKLSSRQILIAALAILAVISVLLICFFTFRYCGSRHDIIPSDTLSSEEDESVQCMLSTSPDDYEDDIEEEETESAGTLPDWMPSDFLSVMNTGDMVEAEPAYVRDLLKQLPYFDGERVSGTFGGYPIRFELSISSDGRVSGRYAYESILRRYGTGSVHWFRVEGSVMRKGDDASFVALHSFHPEDGEEFEYWVMEYNSYDSRWFGRALNISNKGTHGKSWDITLQY